MTNSYYILGIVKQLTVSNLWLLQIFEFLLHQKGQYDGTIPGLDFSFSRSILHFQSILSMAYMEVEWK